MLSKADFRLFVIATRPFAEKIIRGLVFFSAYEAFDFLYNQVREDARPSLNVYSILVKFEREWKPEEQHE